MTSVCVDGSRDRDRAVTAGDGSGQDVLVALSDPDCQCLLSRMTEGARTASELAGTCEIPQSTLYRKLDLLTETGLAEERVRIDRNGKHASEYVAQVDDVVVSFDADCQVAVDVRTGAPA